MRGIFIIMVWMTVFLPTAFSQDAFTHPLKKYDRLLEIGEINEIEYFQLRKEYFKRHYDFTGLEPVAKIPSSVKNKVITGSIFLPLGAGLIAGGILKSNQPINNGPDGAFEHRQKLNNRTSIGFLAAGSITSVAGIILIITGKTQSKKIINKHQQSLSIGIADNDVGVKLQF